MENKGQLWFFFILFFRKIVFILVENKCLFFKKRTKGQNKGHSKFVLYHNEGLNLPAVKKFSEIITIILPNQFMYNYSKNNLKSYKKCNRPLSKL